MLCQENLFRFIEGFRWSRKVRQSRAPCVVASHYAPPQWWASTRRMVGGYPGEKRAAEERHVEADDSQDGSRGISGRTHAAGAMACSVGRPCGTGPRERSRNARPSGVRRGRGHDAWTPSAAAEFCIDKDVGSKIRSLRFDGSRVGGTMLGQWRCLHAKPRDLLLSPERLAVHSPRTGHKPNPRARALSCSTAKPSTAQRPSRSLMAPDLHRPFCAASAERNASQFSTRRRGGRTAPLIRTRSRRTLDRNRRNPSMHRHPRTE